MSAGQAQILFFPGTAAATMACEAETALPVVAEMTQGPDAFIEEAPALVSSPREVFVPAVLREKPQAVITTPEGWILKREPLHSFFVHAISAAPRRKDSAATYFAPQAQPVAATGSHPACQREKTAVSMMLDLLTRNEDLAPDIMAVVKEIPRSSTETFFDTLLELVFRCEAYHPVLDVLFEAVRFYRYQRNAIDMAHVKYSGLDVSHAMGYGHEVLQSTEIEDVVRRILKEAPKGSPDIPSYISRLYLRRTTAHTDYDKLRVVILLAYFLDTYDYKTKKTLAYVRQAVSFLVRDMQSRTEAYKENLSANIPRQRVIESVIGRIMYYLDTDFLQKTTALADLEIGLDIEALLRQAKITVQERTIIAEEISARMQAGLCVNGVLHQDIVLKRLERLSQIAESV